MELEDAEKTKENEIGNRKKGEMVRAGTTFVERSQFILCTLV